MCLSRKRSISWLPLLLDEPLERTVNQGGYWGSGESLPQPVSSEQCPESAGSWKAKGIHKHGKNPSHAQGL